DQQGAPGIFRFDAPREHADWRARACASGSEDRDRSGRGAEVVARAAVPKSRRRLAMGLHHLDHYNIETVNLEETIKFYCEVLGLYVGDRPPLPFPGAWLYAENNQPTIHLIGTNPGE